MAAPNIVNIHFYYSGGSALDKNGLLDDVTPTYQAPYDPAKAAIFLLEFDTALDDTAINALTGSTPPIGILDDTQVNLTGSSFMTAVSGAGYGMNWWKHYDDVHNFTPSSSGAFSGSGPINSALNSNLSGSVPMNHCMYVAVPAGILTAGHRYLIWYIGDYITAGGTMMTRHSGAGAPLSARTSAGPGHTELRLKMMAGVDATAPTIVSFTPANAATNVPVNTPITITFDEELDPATTTGNWTPYPESITYSSKVITVTPSSPLPGTTTINVTAPAGITDTSGNALILPVTWSFTTAAPPDTRVPIEAYAYGFSIDPDQFKSIPLTKSGSIDIDFKIPADDIDGSKIMYLRLRDENGLISPNYRISLRVNDVEFKTFEIDSDPYLIGSVNNVDVRFDIDDTDVSGFQYGYLVDDSSEPTTWASPVITTNSINEYLFNFNLDVSALIAGEHELYVWVKTKEGEKRFRKINFVSEPAIAPPYGTLGIKRSVIEDGKKKVWVEANVFDDGVGVKELSLEDTAYPDNLVNINIIQNKRYLKIFEYDALDNSLRTYKLILVDAIGTYNATPITTTVDLSSVF